MDNELVFHYPRQFNPLALESMSRLLSPSFLLKLRNTLKAPLILGTDGSLSSAENRITIFTNILALVGTLSVILVYFQLRDWGLQGWYLLNYIGIAATALIVFLLNAGKLRVAARVATVLLLNFTSWNALIFFGKSFNGYLLFFVAIAFSIFAFHHRNSSLRWSALIFSTLGLPLADLLSHRGILPVTGLHSSEAPVSVLLFDTFVISGFFITILLIEKYLSEQNEKDLTQLNRNLEGLVEKRTELLKAAREEAMAASRAKSQFIANTSHELRTPLGAVMGFVDLISDPKTKEKEKREYLEVIRRNANQLLQIVDEVLDLSKVEAQKLDIEKERFSLNEFVEDVRSLMSLKAEGKGLVFVMESIGSLPEYIYTDPLRLKQILVNLVGNAIKFTDQGEIRIKISQTAIHGGKTGLQFDISDTGPGIDESHTKSLFEPFSQGDMSLRRKFGGTGLGLSLSKRLAELLGGTLQLIRSEPGEGSLFRLQIDALAALQSESDLKPEAYPANPTGKTSGLREKKILVVDDSPDNQRLVSRFLVLAGASVDIAENGKKALEKVKASAYDAILMDLQMPVLDGYETTRILRQQGVQTPIIAFTAHAMKEERDKTKSLGFTDYLTKPIQRQKLISALAQAGR